MKIYRLSCNSDLCKPCLFTSIKSSFYNSHFFISLNRRLYNFCQKRWIKKKAKWPSSIMKTKHDTVRQIKFNSINVLVCSHCFVDFVYFATLILLYHCVWMCHDGMCLIWFLLLIFFLRCWSFSTTSFLHTFNKLTTSKLFYFLGGVCTAHCSLCMAIIKMENVFSELGHLFSFNLYSWTSILMAKPKR